MKEGILRREIVDYKGSKVWACLIYTKKNMGLNNSNNRSKEEAL